MTFLDLLSICGSSAAFFGAISVGRAAGTKGTLIGALIGLLIGITTFVVIRRGIGSIIRRLKSDDPRLRRVYTVVSWFLVIIIAGLALGAYILAQALTIKLVMQTSL